ncbi:xanthine dehydrogenase family protein molybdopterin-binding subunit [Methylobacterium symbioticum]|uniref:6-hydroxypseudooxynicotine dehydrogenase complex subunit gamma n=1 Tax=Methylobacterium symbioticum TaxID=2584084 RepID=A0A509E8J7_9HYPH|nr:xanthine dehydrogenase family protein molybdopterin-binding subunit [Methylobacterium symbioticum]VUD69819.1 6-hydroxypseudooxynicotine dehydrogenase complex subunit gamma [Methylobacterium symbioticum]
MHGTSYSIGRSPKRLEDHPLLTGAGRFAADIAFPGQVTMRVVRSPIAFGRILDIDTRAALDCPGVLAVWTAADLTELPPIDFRMTRVDGLEPYRQPVLARDFVRYVGEPVAVVFAEDAYAAEDAADLVFCEIDDLAPRLDPLDEPGAFAPGKDAGLRTEPAVLRKGYGDVEAAFAAAHAVVELDVAIGRHSGVPMETRGAVAILDPDTDILTLHGAAKVVHYNRDAIARMLGREPDLLQLSESHVGGGFGIRGEIYPEDVLVCAAALRLRRPVRWIEDRREHLMAANHSRDQRHRMRAAVDARGFILGLDVCFFTDQGAYIRTHGATVSDLAAALLPGPYIVPAYRVEGRIRLTNKTPCGTYRAPGRYETTFARERLIDAIARRLGLDPVAVRRVNLIPETSMPFDRGIDALGTHVVYDSGKYRDLLDRTLDHLGYPALKADLAARRAGGEAVGLGLAVFVEKSGLGPRDLARVNLGPDGAIRIVTGACSIGQGVETAMAQICAETLQVPIARMAVIHGQTREIPIGFGAFASRVTVMTGSAVKLASEDLLGRARVVAGRLLQAEPALLTYRDGAFHHSETAASVDLAGIAAQSGEGLTGEGLFETSHMNYPYGVHVAQVRIDRETCGVTVERYLVAYDIGRAVNPMLVEGQIVGAAVQGIGGALLEEFVYDADGQPLATSFADYLMPTSREAPPIEVLLREDAPSPLNPLGVKGAGEGGLTAAGAAIASAVDDALGHPGLVTRLPITPLALHEALTASAKR